MVILTWFTPQRETPRTAGSLIRELCAIVTAVALVLFVFMSILSHTPFHTLRGAV